MKQIKVTYSSCSGYECESEDFLMDVPDDASPEDTQQLAEAQALNQVNLRVDWKAWPPPPVCKHASVRQERTLRDDAAKIDVCQCGVWRYVGESGGWSPPPFPTPRIVRPG